MRKLLPFLGLFFLVGCSPRETASLEEVVKIPDEQSKENSNEEPLVVFDETRDKASILTYFDSLIEHNQIIVGQHCGDAPTSTADFYNTYVDVLADQTGRHVGIVGADLGWSSGTSYPVNTLIDHWNNGGLVTVSWHADNPFKNGVDVYWNTVENKNEINLKSLRKGESQTAVWTSYRTELDNIAGALQKLRDAGVTVIWRPFHEMNGDFFWWGMNAYNNQQTNEEDYKALWIDLYNTLTFDYGLDNLIWTYSVIPYAGWNADVTSYYPGSDYVDLVGMDYYGTNPDFPDYETLKSLGKTIVMSESGPRDSGYGLWNMMEFANILKGKAAYFLQWHSWNGAKVAIKDNKNVVEMMSSTAVITRDELLPMAF
jgi:mannan endo-1,4-beta-mannosidase